MTCYAMTCYTGGGRRLHGGGGSAAPPPWKALYKEIKKGWGRDMYTQARGCGRAMYTHEARQRVRRHAYAQPASAGSRNHKVHETGLAVRCETNARQKTMFSRCCTSRWVGTGSAAMAPWCLCAAPTQSEGGELCSDIYSLSQN